MSTRLEGVSLHVADVEKSVAFYSKLPGAQLIMHREGEFAKFKIGDGHVQVVAIPLSENTFHIEMNAPDLQALYDELKAAATPQRVPQTTQMSWLIFVKYTEMVCWPVAACSTASSGKATCGTSPTGAR